MKVKDEGYTIVDVPGQEYIQVKPGKVAGEVMIVIKDEAHEFPRAWDVDALSDYVDALQRALSLATSVEVTNDPDRAS